jgi:asparagine synthase (glutamine-hydrolysing)
MPGIVGIIGTASFEENSVALQHMVESMMHESFYTPGTYFNEPIGLSVGWVSHAGSFSDCMPIWNETNDVCLIFSGEDFTDPGDIEGLRVKGHDFAVNDASYLVHLYEEGGPTFFEKLNGWFSGVLVDLRDRSIVLFNDRYGLKRIYYHENKDGFYFSSEAKSLLRVLPGLRKIDSRGLAEIFSCGCVLQNRTLFPEVFVVPGGSAWRFAPGKTTTRASYFEPEAWEGRAPLSGADYYEKLRETWARILPRYLGGKERVGMSLTGGVDGRMIMAWANCPPDALPCYTFGGTFRDCVDVKIARRVARICRQPHNVIPVADDFLSQFPVLAERTVYITDGAMDVSGAPDLFANRLARHIAPVRLTGNYGQEILRSSLAFRPRLLSEELFDKEFSNLLRTAEETYSSELAGSRRSFVAFKQVPWHHFSRLALEQSQLTLRSPYLDNDLVALAFEAPENVANSKELSLRLIYEGSPALGKIATDRGVLYRPIPLATKLSHLYQEITFKAEYAFDYGMPHWLARLDRALAPFHPERLFLGRHKFYHFRTWYRDRLSQYLKDVLLDRRTLTRPYLNGRFLEKMVQDHTEGRGNYTTELHQALTSELIQRTVIERR